MSLRVPRRRGPKSTEPETAVPWDRTLESWNPVSVAVLGILGAVATVVLLLVGSTVTRRSASFVSSQGFALWATVLAVQGGFWSVITVPLWREVIHTFRQTRPVRTIWFLPAIVVLALAVLGVATPARDLDWPLVQQHARTWVLTSVAALGVGLPALFGITLVQDGVRRHGPRALNTNDIRLVVAARGQTERFLGLAGATIGLAVLASGTLQKAVVPHYVPASAFPSSWVLLYGAFFTALLFVVYLPAHLTLRRVCLDLRETWFPMMNMPSPTSQEFGDWLEGRKRLDGLTQLDASVSQQLQAAVFVLTPLLSGIVGSFMPAFVP